MEHWFQLIVFLVVIYEFSYSHFVEMVDFQEYCGMTLNYPKRVLLFVEYISNLPFQFLDDLFVIDMMNKDLNSIGENALAMFFTTIVFLVSYMYYWWDTKKDELYYLVRFRNKSCEFEEKDSPYYKESAIRFADFAVPFYNAIVTETFYPSLDILPVFRGFLDLHKEGWRMKIFPFSEGRIAEEKRLSEERGEEFIIYPDVVETISCKEDDNEAVMAKIGEL